MLALAVFTLDDFSLQRKYLRPVPSFATNIYCNLAFCPLKKRSLNLSNVGFQRIASPPQRMA